MRNDPLLPRCPHFRYRYHPASMRQPQLLLPPLLPPPMKMTHDPSIHRFGGDTRTSYSGSENTINAIEVPSLFNLMQFSRFLN